MSEQTNIIVDSTTAQGLLPTMYAELKDGESLRLLPEEVEVEEIGDRMSSPDDESLTMQTASSIKAVGQQEPCKIKIVDGKPVLFMGRRRRNAISLLNAGMENGAEPLRVWCIVDNSPGDTFQRAVHENIHRKNYSPIELANIVKLVRERNGWKGKSGTGKVAEFLGMSNATVSTHEKILGLPSEILAQGAHEGLSAGALIDLADSVQPEKVTEVIQSAKKMAAKEEAEDKAKAKAAAVARGKVPKKFKTPEDEEESASKSRIKRKHIAEAAREAEALTKPKSRAKSEIVGFFQTILDAAGPYGFKNSPVSDFADYFVNKYCAGTGSEKTARNKFDLMVMDLNTTECYAGMGTPSRTELKAMEEAREKAKAERRKKA